MPVTQTAAVLAAALASSHWKQVVHHDVPPAASHCQSTTSESWDLAQVSLYMPDIYVVYTLYMQGISHFE
jgi:hypothetical protein